MSTGKTVAITGVGGYIGAAIAVHLIEAGHRVVGFGHARNFDTLRARAGDGLVLHDGDLTDRAALDRAFDGADAVVHAASFAGERACRRDMPGAVRTIVRGTRLVVDAVAANAVPRLVHLSTYAAYSTFQEREMPLREADELRPDDLYGTLKAEAEWEAARLPSVILRLTNVFGRGSGTVLKTDAMGHFLRAVREGTPIKLHGGGRQGIEFVHVDDVCRVVEALLDPPREPTPLVLNLGAGFATPIRDVALTFVRNARDILGREVELLDEEAPSDKTWPDRWVSIDRVRHLFPWYPTRTLDDGIRELLQSIQDG